MTLTHADVQANGITAHTVSVGEGPLVLFCHGFPESWYSWRHQLDAVANAGFRAVAMDMRGYGGTTAPEQIGAYSMSHLVGDTVGVVAALGAEQAVIVGHDWGAPVAWYSALMRPDVFRAVAALSVPYTPPIGGLPPGFSMNALMQSAAGDREYYRLYFQEPGRAEAEIEADMERFVRGFLYGVSGDIVEDGVHEQGWAGYFPKGERLVDQLVVPETLPNWITEDDVAFYVGELSRTGIRGGLNWYRNLDALPTVLAPFVGAVIEQPSLYLAGEYDLVAGNTEEALAGMRATLPNLHALQVFSGAGHWLQQERPTEVNEALLDFLATL
ncbi:epoxide hydrolase [Mycolicibacterium madagascariense]|uniref:Epoxide hydrolase n=1 Tax=Mycolicibacterium madagascariense TaxID=212765 RepID=A0A7I7XA12_9MYCO|nr:alpha/beta hydrolase [Mycolicibacterium madagascariense]MCV7012898.1 alpha/beta hydrolase [Mycolicibacterium madagascariense]BBZ26145.1 epoxide hydrolase [Mycolicibacterium madagascariense]